MLASDISSPPCLLRLLPAGANRRVGLTPTGKRRLVTAHPHFGHCMTPVVGSLERKFEASGPPNRTETRLPLLPFGYRRRKTKRSTEMLKLALAAVDPSSDTSTEPRREDRKGKETLHYSKNITKALR